MRASTPTRGRTEHSPLPDFCRLPALFALFVVGALTVTVMWLAGDHPRDWSAYSVSMLFVTWLALVVAVALCKLHPWLQRLPGHLPYVGVWLLILLIVLVASLVAHWFDGALQMQLIRSSLPVFVRDNVLIAALLGAAILRYFYVAAQWRLRLGHLRSEYPKHLAAHRVERRAGVDEDLSRDALLLFDQAEEQVLGADVRVVQLARLLHRQLEDFLGA